FELPPRDRYPVLRLVSAVISRLEERVLAPGDLHAALVDRGGRWVAPGVVAGFAEQLDGFAATLTTDFNILALGRHPEAMARAVNRLLDLHGGGAPGPRTGRAPAAFGRRTRRRPERLRAGRLRGARLPALRPAARRGAAAPAGRGAPRLLSDAGGLRRWHPAERRGGATGPAGALPGPAPARQREPVLELVRARAPGEDVGRGRRDPGPRRGGRAGAPGGAGTGRRPRHL